MREAISAPRCLMPSASGLRPFTFVSGICATDCQVAPNAGFLRHGVVSFHNARG